MFRQKRRSTVGLIRCCLLIGVTTGWAAPAVALDLEKVDRTIVKEPVYRSKTPKYCLVVFGPEAKVRMWLVTDGDRLYVDRNANGDLTDDAGPYLSRYKASEAGSWRVGKIVQAGTKYLDFRVVRSSSGRFHVRNNASTKPFNMWAGIVGRLVFGDAPHKAPILHFGGPLTIRPLRVKRLVRGAKMSFSVRAGTPGHGGEGAFTYVNGPEFKKTVAIRFPAPDGGDNSVELKYKFDIW